MTPAGSQVTHPHGFLTTCSLGTTACAPHVASFLAGLGCILAAFPFKVALGMLILTRVPLAANAEKLRRGWQTPVFYVPGNILAM